MHRSENPATSPVVIALAWIVVAIPLGWGVYQSLAKSLPLFRGNPAAVSRALSADETRDHR